MPEINLLTNNGQSNSSMSSTLASVMSKAFVVVLLLLMAYWGYVLFSMRSARSAIEQATAAIQQDQQDIIQNSGRDELLTRQAQIKEATVAINSHVYWSRFFGDLAKATLKTAAYGAFESDEDGAVTVSVLVPDYQALDQFLQVFDLPAYNGNFSDVRIISVSKSNDDDISELDARIQFQYNVSALKAKTAVTTAR